ncbi:MAG: hypothetical protein HOP08_09355 [Cyclobacteriaceae bacterium]|nr:hypothetical protein [Cyclobacteriaceae bacterium]
METINYKQVIADSLSATKAELGKSWKNFKPYAEHELKQFAENIEFLGKLKLDGVIEDVELKERLELQRLSLKNVLLSMKGVGLITAQNAVNAVLKIVEKALLKALGISLPL